MRRGDNHVPIPRSIHLPVAGAAGQLETGLAYGPSKTMEQAMGDVRLRRQASWSLVSGRVTSCQNGLNHAGCGCFVGFSSFFARSGLRTCQL